MLRESSRGLFFLLLCASLVSLGSCASVLYAINDILSQDGIDDPPASSENPGIALDRTPIHRGTVAESDSSFASSEFDIVELVNSHRQDNGLPALLPHSELASTALSHSRDMGVNDFYSHVTPAGVTPQDRVLARLNDRYYGVAVSENIAYMASSRGFQSYSDQMLAEQFVDMWMNSPGHRANILRPDSTHIGVGLYAIGNRIYATQKFMRYIATLVSHSDDEIMHSNEPAIHLALNPQLARDQDVVVRVGLPDPEARWYRADGRFYRGIAFVAPEWISENEFAVRLPTEEYGPGTYTVRLGVSGGTATFSEEFTFQVR